jgi:hypothetical protein
MFDAARRGDSALLLAALDKGLPANLTNNKGYPPPTSFQILMFG